MADVISSNNEGEGCSTRNTRHGHKTIGTSSNKQTDALATTNALSRCNHSYFKNIIQSLDQRRKDVRYYGFPILLEFDCCSVPRNFVEWIADHIDENCMDIHASAKIIPITPLSIHKALGLHLGGPDIGKTGESGKEDFLKLFEVDEIPSIKTFGSMITSNKEMSDEQFFWCFMVVALSCFLCPNSSTKPSPKYFKPLVDLVMVGSWDWSKFIFDWLVTSIKKYKKRKHTLGGCIYFLAAYRIHHTKD
ncbi:hypothetical protein QOZ80_6AG0531500 [Eleusine coracana subsp. coracana]|nr:hypothetical protein QOZ80_6AG0531500 [Eleusine coracana subsp. coracana]